MTITYRGTIPRGSSILDSFVNSLDLSELGPEYRAEEGPGRPSYDPGDMLKLYLWGYFNGIRSSRKLENECQGNLEAMWLMRKLAPDFKTIADFRKDHLDLVKQVFIKFNSFLEELGLFKSHDVAMDGTKVKAVNSMDRSYTRDYLEISIEEVGELMDKYVKEMEENDAREEGEEMEIDRSKVQEIVKGLNEKRRKLEGIGEEMDRTGATEMPPTDPEARQMMTRHGVDVPTLPRRRGGREPLHRQLYRGQRGERPRIGRPARDGVEGPPRRDRDICEGATSPCRT